MTPAERETAEQILTAAAELFGERGYKGTTTRAIAEKAGVNEVTLFRRFGNKQGVLAALGEMWASQMAGFAIDEMPDPSDTAGTLRALADLEVRQASRFGAAAMRLALDARSVPEVEAVMGGGPGANLEGLAEYLAERQDAGDVRADVDAHALAEGFFLLTSTLVMSRTLLGGSYGERAIPASDAVGALVGVYLDGISAKGGS